MAELPELWTEKTPEPVPNRTPVPADDLLPALPDPAELERAEPQLPEPAEPAELPEPAPERGPFLTHLLLPWSYGDGDREPGEVWHRMKCRMGRHQMVGGQMVQVGGEAVFLEPSCRWCGIVGGGVDSGRIRS